MKNKKLLEQILCKNPMKELSLNAYYIDPRGNMYFLGGFGYPYCHSGFCKLFHVDEDKDLIDKGWVKISGKSAYWKGTKKLSKATKEKLAEYAMVHNIKDILRSLEYERV